MFQADTLNEALNWRYATKKFDDQKELEADLLHHILHAARMAPTSYGLQPFKLFVIDNKDLRSQIYEQASRQTQVVDASALVVFSIEESLDEDSVDAYMDLIAEERNVPKESLEMYSTTIKSTLSKLSEEERQAWAARQAYIAQGFLLQAAALFNVDTCPMEGFNGEKLKGLLPDHSAFKPVVMVAIGYRAADDPYADKAKVRQDKSDFITFI